MHPEADEAINIQNEINEKLREVEQLRVKLYRITNNFTTAELEYFNYNVR